MRVSPTRTDRRESPVPTAIDAHRHLFLPNKFASPAANYVHCYLLVKKSKPWDLEVFDPIFGDVRSKIRRGTFHPIFGIGIRRYWFSSRTWRISVCASVMEFRSAKSKCSFFSIILSLELLTQFSDWVSKVGNISSFETINRSNNPTKMAHSRSNRNPHNQPHDDPGPHGRPSITAIHFSSGIVQTCAHWFIRLDIKSANRLSVYMLALIRLIVL